MAHATSPAVAAAESWNPTSATVPGSTTIIPATAHPRPTIALDPRPLSTASNATAAMTAARTTEGVAPANSVYATIAASVTTARRRRRSSPPRSAATVAATIAMFQPEMATMWLTPAVVKSAATSLSTRSRRPIRIAAASPPSGSGRTRWSQSPETWRKPSSRPAGESSWPTTANSVGSHVAAMPWAANQASYVLSPSGRIRPDHTTRSPATSRGNAGATAEQVTDEAVAEFVAGPPAAGVTAAPASAVAPAPEGVTTSVAICWPLLSRALSTVACHGPVPVGIGAVPSAPPPAAAPTASLVTTIAAPSDATASADPSAGHRRRGLAVSQTHAAATSPAATTPATTAAAGPDPASSAAAAAPRTPIASHAGRGSTAQPTVTSDRNLARTEAATILRVTRSSTLPNRCCSRAATIF